MSQPTKTQKMALELLAESEKSNYQIAKDTDISESTIGNYVNGKTKPTPANAKILVDYFLQSNQSSQRIKTVRANLEMESINSRIKKVREHFCKDSNKKFAEAVGKKPNTVNNWVREGYSVGRGVVSDITTAFPVSANWLLTGEGEMLKSEEDIQPYAEAQPKQLEFEFSKVADACQRAVAMSETLAQSNAKLVDQLIESINRLEKKIDSKKGEDADSQSRVVLGAVKD